MAGEGFGFGNFFRCACGNDFSSMCACGGAEVDEVVGTLDDVKVVLNDEEGMTTINETLEDDEEAFDVGEMKAGGGFVENEEGRVVTLLCAEELAEFETLGLATGEGV